MCRIEYHKLRGHVLKVVLVKREELYPFFGMAVGGVGQEECYAVVREDLFSPVRRFVIQHELYHLVDKHTWWGALGRELRASVVPGLRDPIGLLACVIATFLSWGRIKLYLDRLWKGY